MWPNTRVWLPWFVDCAPRCYGLRAEACHRPTAARDPAATMAANAGGHWVSPTLRRLGDGIRAIERPRAISGQIGGRPRTISDWLGRPRAFSAGPQNVTGQNLAFCHPLSSTASVSAGGPRVGPAAGRSAARGRPRARHGPGAASDRGRARNNAKWMENRPSGVVILQKKPPAFGRRLLFSLGLFICSR